ncbi:MAG: hypothetical protein GEV04_15430 [Actinophytocola sp.]|nr:hypothetical protein [Actinophytocola sp.]
MTTTSPQKSALSTHDGPPLACGVGAGALGTVCCSVGVLGAATYGAGVAAGFTALDDLSPIGSRPLLTIGAFLLAMGLTWLFIHRRTRKLPHEVARAATRRALLVTVLATAVTYVLLMQFVLPLLFITGGSEMGQFSP